jgi:hypothetical protein
VGQGCLDNFTTKGKDVSFSLERWTDGMVTPGGGLGLLSSNRLQPIVGGDGDQRQAVGTGAGYKQEMRKDFLAKSIA